MPRRILRLRALRHVAPLVLASLVACGGGGGENGGVTPPPPLPPVVALSSDAFTLNASVGGTDPLPVEVAIRNGGGGSLGTVSVGTINYSGPGTGWLTSSITGTASPFTLTLTPRVGSLGPGTYVASVPVTASGAASPGTVTITMILTPPPVTSIRFATRQLVVDAGATVSAGATPLSAAGAPVAGATVSYAVRSADIATVDANGAVRGVRTGQTLLVATSGGARDSAYVFVTAPGAPRLILTLPGDGFGVLRDSTVTAELKLDLRSSTKRVGSGSLSVRWDPGVLQYVGHSVVGTNTSALVNMTQAGAGTLALSFADAAGRTGLVELMTITFRAQPLGARTVSALDVLPLELTATDFTSFLTNTGAPVASASYSVVVR